MYIHVYILGVCSSEQIGSLEEFQALLEDDDTNFERMDAFQAMTTLGRRKVKLMQTEARDKQAHRNTVITSHIRLDIQINGGPRGSHKGPIVPTNNSRIYRNTLEFIGIPWDP